MVVYAEPDWCLRRVEWGELVEADEMLAGEGCGGGGGCVGGPWGGSLGEALLIGF